MSRYSTLYKTNSMMISIHDTANIDGVVRKVMGEAVFNTLLDNPLEYDTYSIDITDSHMTFRFVKDDIVIKTITKNTDHYWIIFSFLVNEIDNSIENEKDVIENGITVDYETNEWGDTFEYNPQDETYISDYIKDGDIAGFPPIHYTATVENHMSPWVKTYSTLFKDKATLIGYFDKFKHLFNI